MKKVKIVVAVFSLLTVTLLSQVQNSKTASVIENLEVVALADGESGTSGNTGPELIRECPWPHMETYIECQGTNGYLCTESGCH